MSEVMELAGSFASICKDEHIVPTSRMTQNAICSEMIEPANCVELNKDDMEYVTGEWGWFANHNLKYTCAWNDNSGLNWLLGQAGSHGKTDEISLIGGSVSVGLGLIGTITATSGGLATLLLSAGLLTWDVYNDTLHRDAMDKAEIAAGYIFQQRGYKVFENTVMWNTVTNGYDVEPW